MSDSQTEQDQSSLLHGHTSVEEKDGGSRDYSTNFEKEEIEGGPLSIQGRERDGYALCLGRFRISPVFDTKNDVLEWRYRNEWQIIVSLIITLYQAISDEKTE